MNSIVYNSLNLFLHIRWCIEVFDVYLTYFEWFLVASIKARMWSVNVTFQCRDNTLFQILKYWNTLELKILWHNAVTIMSDHENRCRIAVIIKLILILWYGLVYLLPFGFVFQFRSFRLIDTWISSIRYLFIRLDYWWLQINRKTYKIQSSFTLSK